MKNMKMLLLGCLSWVRFCFWPLLHMICLKLFELWMESGEKNMLKHSIIFLLGVGFTFFSFSFSFSFSFFFSFLFFLFFSPPSLYSFLLFNYYYFYLLLLLFLFFFFQVEWTAAILYFIAAVIFVVGSFYYVPKYADFIVGSWYLSFILSLHFSSFLLTESHPFPRSFLFLFFLFSFLFFSFFEGYLLLVREFMQLGPLLI